MNAPEQRPQEPPVHPPQTQEDVLASVLSDLGRRWGIVQRAAGRAMRQEGPASDAVRAAGEKVRGMIDVMRDAVPGTGPVDPPAQRRKPHGD